VLLIDTAPPVSVTKDRLHRIVGEIYNYVSTYGDVPKNIEALFEKGQLQHYVTDGWGNQIIFTVLNNNKVSVTSYGQDGKPGGQESNSDIVLEVNPYDIEEYYVSCNMGVSPWRFTAIKLRDLERSICAFAGKHGRLPTTLKQLPELDSEVYNTIDKDFWGHQIEYAVVKDCVTLTSFGEDGILGGIVKNADIIISFTVATGGK
jgi:hypothetical protein